MTPNVVVTYFFNDLPPFIVENISCQLDLNALLQFEKL